jgi:hypothetical protein
MSSQTMTCFDFKLFLRNMNWKPDAKLSSYVYISWTKLTLPSVFLEVINYLMFFGD